MSRSLNDLRYELKDKGEVRIPRVPPREIVSQMSFVLAIALAGFAFLLFYPYAVGRWTMSITLLGCAAFVFVWAVRDWRRQLVVTPEAITNRAGSPVMWIEVEKIGIPAARSMLSLQLTSAGLHRYSGLPVSTEDIPGEDRVLVWDLSTNLSKNELRFLRELANRYPA